MRWLSYICLKLAGWKFLGVKPPVSKTVVIAAPHTSNWDFIMFLGALHAFGLKARFIGKHTLFRWPFGYFFRALGGIPTDRSKPGGVVGEVTRAFERVDEMHLVIAPEGTRLKAEYWKSGFLRMAESARVPIVMASVDFVHKEVVLADPIAFDGNDEGFMDQARRFYEGKTGRHPDWMGPVRLRQD